METPADIRMERTSMFDNTVMATFQTNGTEHKLTSSGPETGIRRRKASKSDAVVGNSGTVEQKNTRDQYMSRKHDNTVLSGVVGMPSAEIRRAAQCFVSAIDQAIALVAATNKIDLLLRDSSVPHT